MAGHDERNRDAVTLLNWISAVVLVVTIVVGVGMAMVIGLQAARVTLGGLVLCALGVAQIVLRRGHIRQAVHILMFSLWLVITAWLFLVGGTHSYVVFAYGPVIATSSVAIGRRAGIFYSVVSTLALGGLFLLERNGAPVPEDLSPLFRFLLATASLLMTGFVIQLASRLKEEAARRAVASEAQYAELVRTAPDCILWVDAEGVLRGANPAAEALFGQASATLVGCPVKTLPGLESLSATCASVTITRGDGSQREVEIESRPVAVGGSDGTRLNLRDVTDQRAAERDRARLTEQLAQVQRLESVGLLAGGIAHDFNNVSTVTLSSLEALRHLELGAEPREHLDDIEQATQRAVELTRKLLAFSRRQVMHVHNISINEVVEGVRPMLRRLVPETIEMRYELSATGIVAADAGQMEQVVMNLVVNARDVMPEGGTVTITTRDERAADSPVVVLTVEDSGGGIPADVLPRVFEPFFTTKELGRGTGLGLSVVDGIVRQSGGTVAIDSVVGRGTRFEIRLPCVSAAAPDRETLSKPVAASGGGRVVLVVEDEPALLRVAQRALESAGFEVVTAADGEEAIVKAKELGRPFEVVVADVMMPRLGGPEVVARLRERWPTLKALFVSGYTDRTLEELGARHSNSAFLGKPFRGDQLVAAVSALLGD